MVSSSDRSPRRDLTARGIEREVADPQHLVVARHARAAQQRTKARQQLVERERLHEVVVGAGVEPGDPVAHLVAGGEHEHGRAVAPLAQAPARGEPVDVRHQHVEHDHVGLRLQHRHERLGAVAGGDDVVALEGEGPHEGVAHALVVLGHEHPARGTVLRAGAERHVVAPPSVDGSDRGKLVHAPVVRAAR